MPRYVELFPKVLFRSRNPAPFRAIVIGNHQARYLAPLFELILADCSCDYLSYHEIDNDDQRAAVENYLDETRDDYKLVIAQPLGAEWQAIAKEALIARFGRDRTFFLLNLYFRGAYPDVTALGDAATRVFGPMDAWHSRIALGGWMAGLKVPDIIALFNPESIGKLGFSELFEASLQDLRDREAECDTKFADSIVDLVKKAFCFYSFNNPTPNLLAHYLSHMRNLLHARRLRLSQVPFNAMFVSETLVSHGAWPVYPELRELVAPHFPVSTIFVLPDRGFGSEVITRETFVRRSVELYDGMGRDRIAELREAQNSHELVQHIL